MRIFCCSNRAVRSVRRVRWCFNPPCGFFVVRTWAICVAQSRIPGFQSAMRIFCCSNDRARIADGFYVLVSIRHADFLLFERLSGDRLSHRRNAFQSAMRIFCCSNAGRSDLSPVTLQEVSIRHADFLLFELRVRYGFDTSDLSFNPPCGFFVVRTPPSGSFFQRQWLFQSAMRIFCCSNRTASRPPAARC